MSDQITPEDDLAIATAQLLRRIPRGEKRVKFMEALLAGHRRQLKQIWGSRLSSAELERRVLRHRAAIEAAIGDG